MKKETEKIIVTGGAGFIGRHISKALLDKGYDVHIIDILVDEFTGEEVSNDILKKYFSNDFIKNKIHKLNVLDYYNILPIFKNAKAVIHLAAFISSPNSVNEPKKAFETNIQGTINVLEAARNNDCQNIIITSSAAVYGNADGIKHESHTPAPENPYALSKHIKEQLGNLYVELYGMNITSIRYSNVWGPDQHDTGSYAPAIGRFIKQIKDKQPVTICGDGEQTRDFIHVYDVVSLNLQLLENLEKDELRGKVFNVCAGVESKILDLAHLIKNIATEKNYDEATIIHIEPRKEPKRFVGDNSKVKSKLDWEPKMSLEKGIRELF